jgi:cation diffusion facilitator family transporter
MDDDNDHHDGHHDLNLKAAYLHALADAATSVLAIVALAGGMLYGWSWLDPVMGIVGAALVAVWAKGLIVDTGKVLLDREMDHHVVDELREVVAQELSEGDTRLTDVHVWRVGRSAYAAELALASHDMTLTPDRVRRHLAQHEEIVHVTVEVNRFSPSAGR